MKERRAFWQDWKAHSCIRRFLQFIPPTFSNGKGKLLTTMRYLPSFPFQTQMIEVFPPNSNTVKLCGVIREKSDFLKHFVSKNHNSTISDIMDLRHQSSATCKLGGGVRRMEKLATQHVSFKNKIGKFLFEMLPKSQKYELVSKHLPRYRNYVQR